MSSAAVEARRSRFDQTTIRSASGRLAESLHAPIGAGDFVDRSEGGGGVGLIGFAGWAGGRRTMGCATFPTGADAAERGWPTGADAAAIGGGDGGGGGAGCGLARRLRVSLMPSRSPLSSSGPSL